MSGEAAPETRDDILRAMRRMGLDVAPNAAVVPLTGGVSSDVFRVDLADGPVCVKRALARLKVVADWRAPVDRVHNEVAWLRFAAGVMPNRVPVILGEDRDDHLFAMSFLPPEKYPVWKALLRDGHADPAFAAAVGDAIGAIHAASAGSAEIAKTFATGDLFMALRLEPYLLYTAKAHPDRAERINAMVASIAAARTALMHGDVSPKNILEGPDGPIFLDAETACYGDPAFDLAFCLNHLLLKCIWVPEKRKDYGASFAALCDAYFKRVSWEPVSDIDRRTAGILSAFLLA
ncbi:MAG TPA: aminoglycoside phosphotransferase family protein, partial [Rhizomicrobium sp.]|nr:aminoglycoside phosphotransferase family protein [Rhizomicrobium sp.]